MYQTDVRNFDIDSQTSKADLEQRGLTEVDEVLSLDRHSLPGNSRSHSRLNRILEEIDNLDSALDCNDRVVSDTPQSLFSTLEERSRAQSQGTELPPIDITHEVSMPSWMKGSERNDEPFEPYDGQFGTFIRGAMLTSLVFAPLTTLAGAGIAAEMAQKFLGLYPGYAEPYELAGALVGLALPGALIMAGPLVVGGAIHLWNKFFD